MSIYDRRCTSVATRHAGASAPSQTPEHMLLALQRAIGNRAVAQLLSRRTTGLTQPPDQTGLSNWPSSGSTMHRSDGRMIQRATHLVTDKLNVVGEKHNETEARLDEEKKFCALKTVSDNYWEESSLLHRQNADAKPTFADPVEQRALQSAAALAFLVRDKLYPAAKKAVDEEVFLSTPDYNEAAVLFRTYGQVLDEEREQFTKYWEAEYKATSWPEFEKARETISLNLSELARPGKKPSEKTARKVKLTELEKSKDDLLLHWQQWRGAQDSKGVRGGPEKMVEGRDKGISMERSIFMDEAAKGWAVGFRGVWKIGQEHVDEILLHRGEPTEYNLVPKAHFDDRFKEG